jgi:hypothetical protein
VTDVIVTPEELAAEPPANPASSPAAEPAQTGAAEIQPG